MFRFELNRLNFSYLGLLKNPTPEQSQMLLLCMFIMKVLLPFYLKDLTKFTKDVSLDEFARIKT